MNLNEIRKRLNLGESISNIPLKVTYYARVSTEHYEQTSSLENQKQYFIDLITSNKKWTYVEGYIDKGISGTTDIKREQFMQMINDAEQNMFDLIITKEISRFSRNTLDSIKYTRKLLEYGVAVLFINDNINTILQDSELRLTIMSSLAQDEIRRLSERVKFGMAESTKNGHILGNQKLYGYYKDKNTGNLKIIKKEATITKRLYTMYTEKNISLNKIANIFNQENIKTKTGKKWSITTLKRILENPKYKGYFCGHKSEITDYMTKKVHKFPKEEWICYKSYKKIPPIIDEDLWNKTQIKLNNNSKKIIKKQYILSNKIFCYNDKFPYYRRTNKKEVIWLCSNYIKHSKASCDSKPIYEKDIYNILKKLLIILKIDPQKIKDILYNIYEKKIEIEDKDIYDIATKLFINKIIIDKEKMSWYLNIDYKLNYTHNIKTTKNNYIINFLSIN